jgi:heme exporter protein B
MPNHYWLLLKKDLLLEWHTKEMLTSMGIYAVLVLVVFGVAIATTSTGANIAPISGGLIWAMIVFTSLLGLNRSFAHEKEEACLEGIMLAPLDRSLIFLAKASSNLIFLLVVEIIAVPLYYIFFLAGNDASVGMVAGSQSAPIWLALAPLVVGTIGFAGIGTLLATITVNTRGKDVLLAVLFVPLVFPLLYSVVAATTTIVTGTTNLATTFVPAMAVAIGYDVIMLLVCWLLYDYLVSA